MNKKITTKDFLKNDSGRSLSGLYIRSNAPGIFSFITEQLICALAGWIPTAAGMVIRGALYRLLLPRGSSFFFCEQNVDIKYFSRLWCGRNVFFDRNCRIHSSPAGIRIGSNSRIMFGSYLCAFSSKLKENEGIYIGESCWVGINCVIAAGEARVEIGDNTLIGPNVTIVTGNHKFESGKLIMEQSYEQEPINIGKDCWLGANSVILGGVKIGDHSVIAAGAVVNKDVPPHSIAGGVPAKLIAEIK
ncbi:MAG: acyltransferase [Candidatus Omnitrophica bacterium]|nr:acyltransferase [Candidatus Omnitrophota bacterium]MDD5553401.1 acyltransferase [Candidatus Omnitrophota bacterium]